ncbi:MAG TPA: GTP-binding protein [Acidobacteriaceae bacterium]|nr:GTP-binding protein [Acidobacteriaceae bacterium]
MSMDSASNKPWVAIIGGFLGSGKTTLILAAAQELERRGIRSAIVLNDQGNELVDTGYATRNGMRSGEVTGGCFCCKLSDLIRVMGELRAHSPEVIFAEPVGSCTDISATILHPLLEYRDEFRLAPFTVLVDPERAKTLIADDANPDLSFLFRKQLQEADLLCFTKSDLYPDCPEISAQHVRQLSALTGQGVAAWLDEIFSGSLMVGREILDIDYEQYARAEAALVWLNLQVTIEPTVPSSPAIILGPLLDHLDREFTAKQITIVHLKAIVDSATGFLKAAMCANSQEPAVDGALDASPASKHELLLNLRAIGWAPQVREIVERELDRIDGKRIGLRMDCFHPAAPKPERRITRVR